MKLLELTDYINQLLKIDSFTDYCPNGLQVEGRAEIKTLVSGVTASQALLDAAIAAKADAVLVHHGYFWKGEDACVRGIKHKRLASLIKNDISLLAYHLPLDVHNEFGNNVQLARVLGIHNVMQHDAGGIENLLALGQLVTPMSGNDFAVHIEKCLGRAPLYIDGGAGGSGAGGGDSAGASEAISRVAWCTGAAQDYIEDAIALGADAYITGEVSERTVHIVREAGIHFYAAGHHATERYGIQALGDHLAQQFSLSHQFIDIANPV